MPAETDAIREDNQPQFRETWRAEGTLPKAFVQGVSVSVNGLRVMALLVV